MGYYNDKEVRMMQQAVLEAKHEVERITKYALEQSVKIAELTRERDILAEALKLGNNDLVEWFMMSYERCYWSEEVKILGECDIALNNDLEKHAFCYAIAKHKLEENDGA